MLSSAKLETEIHQLNRWQKIDSHTFRRSTCRLQQQRDKHASENHRSEPLLCRAQQNEQKWTQLSIPCTACTRAEGQMELNGINGVIFNHHHPTADERPTSDMEEFSVSVILDKVVKNHYRFLRRIYRDKRLHSDAAISNAIRRYESYWLPLLSKCGKYRPCLDSPPNYLDSQ